MEDFLSFLKKKFFSYLVFDKKKDCLKVPAKLRPSIPIASVGSLVGVSGKHWLLAVPRAPITQTSHLAVTASCLLCARPSATPGEGEVHLSVWGRAGIPVPPRRAQVCVPAPACDGELGEPQLSKGLMALVTQDCRINSKTCEPTHLLCLAPLSCS